MRTPSLSWPFFLAAAALIEAGCLVDRSGVQDTTEGVGGAALTSSTSAAGGAGGLASSTASTGPGCASTVEICDDGIDNDCNSLIDCADPQCAGATGRECVAPAPAGWTLVAYVTGDGATCPQGYEEIAKVAEAPSSTSSQCSCACDCAGAQNNPCEHGTLNAVIGTSCSALSLTLSVTGGCDPLGQKLTSQYGSIKATPLPVAPVDVAVTGTLPGTQPGAVGVTCGPSAGGAGGCDSGQACLLKTPSASRCIQKPGDVVCPAGPLTKRRVVGAPGSATDDQRTCAACACSSSAASCSGATFSGHLTAACSAMTATAPVIANVCSMVSGSGSWENDTYFVYSATAVAPTCTLKGAAPSVLGTITPKVPTTLCCAP